MSDDPRASSTGRDAPGRFVLSAQELHQRVGRLLRLLFQHPVSRVLQNDDRYVRGHELQLRALELAQGFLTSNGQYRNCQLCLREFTEVLVGDRLRVVTQRVIAQFSSNVDRSS